MKALDWRNERELVVDGVRFECSVENYKLRTDRDRLVLLKNEQLLKQYASVFADAPPKNMLEFGVFQGGSPALFAAWLDVEEVRGN